MTYCLAIALKSGLIFASDSRTNAGVDNISTHSKMHLFGVPGERQFVLLSAGNLATTQAVVGQIKQDLRNGSAVNLMTVSGIPEAADYIGSVNVETQGKFAHENTLFQASFIIGGQVRNERPKVRLVYPEGNHIGSSKGTPFLQIGESKYGKPILDRILSPDSNLDTGASCALVSMDSTMRSNLTVGPPIEVMIYEGDSFALERHYRFEDDSEYLRQIRKSWDQSLKEAFKKLPPISWGPTWDQEANDGMANEDVG